MPTGTTAASEADPSWPTLLLLTDGRFPSGGHAHSGGIEAAVALEGVRDLETLERFLRGRLATAGRVAAAFAAATCRHLGAPGTVALLDDEFDARTASPALRAASRRLGRQLLRAGRAIWPHDELDRLAAARRGPHQPVALGAIAAAAGLPPPKAALAAAHDTVTGPATAAVRLLGLDPFAVHTTIARLAAQVAEVAAAGAGQVDTPPAELPALTGPLLEISAEHHARWEVRLFAS